MTAATRRGHTYPTLALTVALMVFFAHPCLADEFRVMEYQEDYPPVFFREKGQPKGIVPDVLAAIGSRTGDRFVFVKAPFLRLQLMFDNGEIDIEPSVNPAWREKARVKGRYTIPYCESVNVFIFPDEKSAFDAPTPGDLEGKLFGTVRGYDYLDLQPALENGSVHAVSCGNEAKLLQLLALRRIDTAVIHKPFAQYQMKKRRAYSGFCIGRQFSRLDIMMRFHPDRQDALERFNEAIEQMIAAGEIKEIYDRYR